MPSAEQDGGVVFRPPLAVVRDGAHETAQGLVDRQAVGVVAVMKSVKRSAPNPRPSVSRASVMPPVNSSSRVQLLGALCDRQIESAAHGHAGGQSGTCQSDQGR
ncbi:hypothetical protein [Streptomyces sp. NPDC008121]|uniref:hypothetical protein n=1 Tax=Streptomyces sp. NPDC008121 TaxID=3364809 RepID=UPI0036E523CF